MSATADGPGETEEGASAPALDHATAVAAAIGNPERVAAARRLALLGGDADEAFDRLVLLAARALGVPMALVNLIDGERQHFRGCVGLPEPWASQREMPLSMGLCPHVVYSGAPLVIEHTEAHPLARTNLLVTGLGVRAYAGVPLRDEAGNVLGTICALDARPRRWTADELAVLHDLAAAVMTEIRLRQGQDELRQQMGAYTQLNTALREVAEERDRALAEVEAAIKIRDDFLAAASHDLKNPLAAVRGTAQILQRTLNRSGAVPPERLAEGLQSIITSAGQMTSLIDGLLDVTRLQVGQQLTLQRHPTDLVTLVTRAASTFQQSTDRHRLRVVLPAPTGGEGDQDGHGRGVSLVGEWDEGRLERVIGNLLSNAIKYSPEGGEITISVGWEAPGPAPASEAADGWAVLRVRDQGVGIPAADLPRVFDRFSRGGNVVGRISGSGFGLSVARQIVEGHGGTISVESDLGQGSTFTVRLPL